MAVRLLLAADDSLPAENLNSCFELCSTLATVIGEPVYLATLDGEQLDDLRAWVLLKTEGRGLEGLEPKTVSNAPMSAAPFVYRDDGRPDWATMWQGFCDLALYGGPPHRGPDNPVQAEDSESDAVVVNDAIVEIRRGIYETTGLFAEPAPPNWMAVTCHDRRMAAWMCAAIILENVDARCEEEVLYVPASPDFELTNQVKSVITVVAKVNHYWQAHVAEQEALSAG
jgi:sirohydrochlorin cobaltochelatase